MTATPQPLAIVPFYKRRDQLDRCLAALAAGSVQPQPFVHDNSITNLGFTAACNLGLREAARRGDAYALLINQDCYVEPETVSRAVAFMDAYPRCAIAGVKQLRFEDPDQIVHGGCTDAYPEGKHIEGWVSACDCTLSRPMPWVNGACWIVRMAAVTEIGLMDEGFFLVCSDADYCFTARQRGWEVWYCAEAVVRHETGGVSSAGAASLEHIARLQADQRRFRDKWLGTLLWDLLRLPIAKPGELTALVEAAQQLFTRGEIVPAEIASRRALAANPQSPDAKLVLGRALLRQGWGALAVAELEPLAGDFPLSAAIQFALADALTVAGDWSRAVDLYAKAEALGVPPAALQHSRGVALARLAEAAAVQHPGAN